MKHFSPILQDLINAFKGLPGIGVKSAQRIVFNLIQHNQEKALFLSDAIKNALENINDNLPDLVMIDTECDNINSIVLINLVSRDSKFNNTEIHYITSKSVSDPEGFKKENQVKRIWPKPANISEIINYLSSQS